MPAVAVEELRRLVMARLRQRFDEPQAAAIAEVVIFGELSGRPSHGILRILPGSFGAMDEAPGPPPQVLPSKEASAQVIGRPGMLVMAMATDVAIEIAQERGFAVVTTRGSRSTTGSLAYYVERLANAGLVAFVSSGTLGFVSPPGVGARALGTNPMAFGIPAIGHPLVVDIATASGTVGEVISAAAAGAPLPPGMAVDFAGRETTEAALVLEGGALLAFGGHKGLGLSMMIEVLNAALTGASPGLRPDEDWGNTLVAFSLALLGDPDEIRRRAQDEIDRLASLTTVDGSPVRVPGHRSLGKRDEALRNGMVVVDDESWARLSELVGG